jgi:hypothetical protein
MKKIMLVLLALSIVLILGCPSPQGTTTSRDGTGGTSPGTGTEYVFTPDTSQLSGTPNFFGITYGNGLYVAVADSGTVITSADGTDWNLVESNSYSYRGERSMAKSRTIAKNTPHRSRTLAPQKALSLPAPHFKAAPAGRSLLPPGGEVPSDIPTNLYGVAFGAGKFVAAGEGYSGEANSLYWSADGSTWTAVAQDLSEYSLFSISFVNGVFIATGYKHSDEQSYFLLSSDGSAWTAVQAPVNDTYGGVACNGSSTYVAVGYNGTILTSSNGSLWSATDISIPESVSPVLMSVAFGNGIFVAVGYDWNTSNLLILVSADGKNWSSQDLPLTGLPTGNNLNFYLSGVAAGNDGFVVVGDYWYSESPGGSIVLTSTTGRSWQYQYWNTLASSVVWGNGLYAIARGDSYWDW